MGFEAELLRARSAGSVDRSREQPRADATSASAFVDRHFAKLESRLGELFQRASSDDPLTRHGEQHESSFRNDLPPRIAQHAPVVWLHGEVLADPFQVQAREIPTEARAIIDDLDSVMRLAAGAQLAEDSAL